MIEKKWEVIDTEGLCTSLAENDWIEQTKSQNEEDLYEDEWESGNESNGYQGSYKKQVKAYWGSLFFNLRNKYAALVDMHRQKI